MFVKQAPDDVDPAQEDADSECDDDGDEEADEARLVDEGGPADDHLGDPVDAWNQKKKDLHEARLLIEPFHLHYLRKVQ